jgi:hypothetical protein
LHRRGCELEIIHCDSEVAKVEAYNVHKGLVEFVGRGGTDFSPVFQYLRSLPWHKRPAFLVFYTDGMGGCEKYLEELGIADQTVIGVDPDPVKNRPEKTPDGVEVLWLLTKDGDEEQFKSFVPFGTVRKLG